ncbi:type IV pilus modification PilV family protein [Paenisporosarcina sp. NPDC076898]
MKNQKGYILLIVLMLVMVFSVLGISLMSLNITSAKQFDSKEKTVQARHAAEMGAQHYRAYIVKEWDHVAQLNKVDINSLNSEPPGQQKKVVDKYRNDIKSRNNEFCNRVKSYKLITSEYTVSPSSMQVNCNLSITDPLKWDFTVISKKNSDDKGVSVAATVKMDAGLYETPGDTIIYSKEVNDYRQWTSFDNNVNVDIFSTNKNKQMLLFNKNLTANDFNLPTHSCAIIKGKFEVKNYLRTKNKSTIFVLGDAYIPSNFNYHKNHGGLFVVGNVYIDGVLQNPKPYMGIDPSINPGNCKVPSNLGNSSNQPELIITYN